MHNATQTMLELLKPLSAPYLLPSEEPRTIDYRIHLDLSGLNSGVFCWQIKEKKFEESTNRFHLVSPQPQGKVALPTPDLKLMFSLLTNQYRHDSVKIKKLYQKLRQKVASFLEDIEDSAGLSLDTKLKNRTQNSLIKLVKTCQKEHPRLPEQGPDVFVFDDLNLGIGSVKFALVKKNNVHCNVKESSKLFVEKLGESAVIERDYDQSVEKSGVENSASRFDNLIKKRKELNQIALQLLCARLFDAASSIEGTGFRYPVEPVLILSAAGGIPDLCEGGISARDKSKTIWNHIHGNPTLRRRSVVLLDAETIRQEISVSAGLSWERTAQDTIIEIRRNRKLRPFLRFGHVVIRFGLTGILLISNNSDYTLYFNPDRHDIEFTGDEDGEVLGATSVIVATIIEKLNGRCRWRNGHAVLPDLKDALDSALRLSVQRILVNFECGYGQNPDELLEKERSDKWYDSRVFVSESESLKAVTQKCSTRLNSVPMSVQRVKLLPFRSRYWSILAQSSQSDLNNVAKNIVKYGSKVTFNSVDSKIAEIAVNVIDEALDKLKDDAAKHARDCTLFLSAKEGKENIYFHPDEDDDVEVANEIMNCLNSIGVPEEDGVLRIVGKPFYEVLKKFRSSHRTSKKWQAICATLRNNSKSFDNELSNLSKIVLGKKKPSPDKIEAVVGKSDVKRHCFLLTGRRGFLDKIGNDYPDNPEMLTDEAIRLAYGKLRNEVLRGDLANSEDAREIREILKKIEESYFFDPKTFLATEFANLFKSFEPCEGWSETISTPVLRLGNVPRTLSDKDERLTVVDRKEVESIRAVKRLVDQYLQGNSERPLSIAVFGPPGSGKSVAVKKIVQSVSDTNSGKPTDRITVNMSQLTTVDELYTELQNIKNRIVGERIPVIFFDEFDSSLKSLKLGWLKNFLGLMEDSKFRDVELRQAVLVFAGGTSDTFEEFSLADRSIDDPQWSNFSEVKGPDFVSRLSGHINMVGLNPASPDDDLFLIRRALSLRFFLTEHQGLKDTQEARIDEKMINAFLFVPEYRHGARSMRMLIDLCMSRKDHRISMSEVPPIHQLNMQVDGKAFAALASGQTRPVYHE
ncbi:MAG: AAA family ATPase [Planctomycetota bacterium]